MRLRAGVVGLGNMGRNHARVLQELDRVDFMGGADEAGDVYDACNGHNVYTNASALIGAGLDVCIVATPTRAHLDVALLLAEASIATLIEKPLASDLESCDQLVRAFESTKTLGCVGHIERYNPAIQEMRGRLQRHELGVVFQIATERQGPVVERKIGQEGVIMDLATHDLDLVCWLRQEEFRSVAAQTAYPHGSAKVEELVAITGVLDSGVVTNHLVNRLSPAKKRTVTVWGEAGKLTADMVNSTISYEHASSDRESGLRREPPILQHAEEPVEPLFQEISEFVSAAQGLAGQVVSLADGRRAVALAQACHRAALTQRTVDLTGLL